MKLNAYTTLAMYFTIWIWTRAKGMITYGHGLSSWKLAIYEFIPRIYIIKHKNIIA